MSNIVEEFIKQNGKLVIFVSGLAGSGKTIYGKKLAQDMNLHHINVNNFREHKNIKMDALEKEIKENKGVVITGFPLSLKDTDHHINLSINQTIYLQNLGQNNNMEKEKEFQTIIKPYYDKIIAAMKVNKFINVKKFEKNKIYDMIWDSVINYIKKWLLKRNPTATIE